jgi:glycosyltransferase involved in cell wall biosynthesis
VIRSRGFWRDRGPLSMSPLAADADLDVSFVVPFYNPGATLRPHLEDMVRVLDATRCSYEIIPVSDGSTDGSELTLLGLPPTVRPIVNDTNFGKGHALHIGLNEGRGRYLGFVDADGDIPAELLTSFVDIVRDEAPEVAIGSKKHADSDVVYPLVRRVYSTGYQLLTRVLFGLSVRDTQTGLKIIRRDVLAAALPRMLEKRFAFDLELLVVARRLGYRTVVELPVVIQERLTTTISWRSVLQVLQDTAAIAYRLHLVGWYDEDHDTRSHVRDGSLGPVQAL